jgi:hypothetical protein
MLDQSQIAEFTDHDLEVIKDALFTQEKILAVQSRAGGNGAKTRLNELRGLLYRLRGNDNAGPALSGASEPRQGIWQQVTRIMSH